ncbi:MAG: hypothetical protein R3228_08980 [Halioglobus sp.]|nr:hypothetical protein [Halioglobus sp.]
MTLRQTLVTLLALALLQACTDNDEPLTPLAERYVLGSPDSVPEGVAFDPWERRFYATSLNGGSITRISADGTESIFRAADGRAELLGAKVDPVRNLLWVCAQGVDGLDNRVWTFDISSAEMTGEYFLGALATDGSCNDLVLDSDGTAYVTDPANPFIYALDPDSGEGRVLATDPLFADVTGSGLGLNGIAIAPDGDALIVAKFLPPSLLRVSLPGAETVEQIALDGALPFPDGLAELGGDIYAVSNDSVSRIRLGADGNTGSVVTRSQISGLSTATTAEGALYAIKSEVFNFVGRQTLNTPFEIFRVDLDAFDQ